MNDSTPIEEARPPAPSPVVQLRPGAWWAIGFGLLTVLVLVGAAEARVSVSMAGKEVDWSTVLGRSAMEWYTWGLFTVGIVRLADRFPLEREFMRSRVALHGLVSVLIGVLYLAALAALLHGRPSVMEENTILRFGTVFWKMLASFLVMSVILYWFVLLAHNGWHYYGRARLRERQAAELQAQLAEARLMALRMQLHPHFLFNTLNTISALIHERPEDADRMVVRLSELLRMTLDGSAQQEVSLGREIGYVQKYLEVESIRFEDRLAVEYQVDPAIRDLAVPCLLLQPIVENAVRHGIEPRERDGRIVVAARASGDLLEFEVTDNGPGLPPGRDLREGIGLSNTRARLRQLYGDQQRVELSPAPGGGLRVKLVLPRRALASATSRHRRPEVVGRPHPAVV